MSSIARCRLRMTTGTMALGIFYIVLVTVMGTVMWDNLGVSTFSAVAGQHQSDIVPAPNVPSQKFTQPKDLKDGFQMVTQTDPDGTQYILVKFPAHLYYFPDHNSIPYYSGIKKALTKVYGCEPFPKCDPKIKIDKVSGVTVKVDNETISIGPVTETGNPTVYIGVYLTKFKTMDH